jgi:hypothetical protein
MTPTSFLLMCWRTGQSGITSDNIEGLREAALSPGCHPYHIIVSSSHTQKKSGTFIYKTITRGQVAKKVRRIVYITRIKSHMRHNCIHKFTMPIKILTHDIQGTTTGLIRPKVGIGEPVSRIEIEFRVIHNVQEDAML